MLKLQFLTGKKHNEEWSTVKNCNFSTLQFFKCTFTVISLHIFAVQLEGLQSESVSESVFIEIIPHSSPCQPKLFVSYVK